ncbi:MAG: L-threonylcarbamoyladenylate synthase [Rhodothalassiaceae bacterium]
MAEKGQHAASMRRADAAAIAEGALLLRSGALVAMPTETVYGLAGDATDDRAVARIFAAKGRPRFNPLICHVADAAMAERLVKLSDPARRLIAAFWPGPLTLVLERHDDCPVSELAAAGLPTLAVRQPAHPVARALIHETGRPLAAPSANRSGRISPTSADDVAEELGDSVAMILDGGPSPIGLESSVVAIAGEDLCLLRPGAVTAEDIRAKTGLTVRRGASDAIVSPGQMTSHYAPEAGLRLDARAARPGEILIGFWDIADDPAFNLSPVGDMVEAAANLFRLLREADRRHPQGIAVAPIPGHGLGLAINDRLQRAAAPRGDER